MIDPSMMGGGAPQGGGQPPQTIQLPGGGTPDSTPPDSGGDPVALMREVLDKARQAAVAEPDDAIQANMEKLTTLAAQILADIQKGQDDMMGTSPAHKAMRRTLATQGGGGAAY